MSDCVGSARCIASTAASGSYVASRIRIIMLCVVRNALEAAQVSVRLDEVKYWLAVAHCPGRGVSRCVAVLDVAFATRGGHW